MEMEGDGVIEPSSNPQTVPVVLVKKGWNFLVLRGLRQINNATKKENYSLPRIDGTQATIDSRMNAVLGLGVSKWILY